MDLSHPISDLVESFLDAAQVVVSSVEPDIIHARPAELTYELDQVVSNYLEDHQLSPDHYDAIHQAVINTIAHQFSDGLIDEHSSSQHDQAGNSALIDVLSLLDCHLTLAVSHSPIDDPPGPDHIDSLGPLG